MIEVLAAWIYTPPKPPPKWDAADIGASQIVNLDANDLPARPVFKADPSNLTNYLPQSLVALDAKDLSMIKVAPVVGKTGKTSRVSAVYDARPRNSFIAALKDIPEVWKIPCDGRPVYNGLVRDYQYKEAIAEPGPLPLRQIVLDDAIDDFFLQPERRHHPRRLAHEIGAGYQNRDSYVNEFVVKTPIAGAGVIPVTGWQATTSRDGTPGYLIGDKGRTPWTSANATVKLSYKLDARDKVYGGISWQETEQDYTPFTSYLRNSSGATVSTGVVNINGEQVTSLSLFDFVNNSPLHEAATRIFAGYEGIIGTDKLLKVDLAQIDRKYSFTAASPMAPSYEGGPGTLTDTPNSGLDGSIQLSFPMGEKQFWVTGLAFHRDEVKQKIYTLSNWRDDGSRTKLNNGYNGTSTTTSLFAQDEIALTNKLKAYLGGRWDYWETKGDFFNTLPPPAPQSERYSSRSDSAFSPKASMVYKPVEAATLRASYGRSFRTPPNLDLYSTSTVRCILDNQSTGTCIARGNPDLEPETGTTWEVGGDWRFTNSTQAGLTVYETRLKDLIYTKRTPGNLIDRINAGEARVRGIELTARTRLTKWLELDANYAWIDSEMLENDADPSSVGKRLTNSPEHIAGIGLTAQHGPWTGTLNARYVSHVYFTAANTDVVEGVPGSYDAYTLVNAKAGYAFSKTVKASLGIHNLLDEKAYSFFLLPGRSAVAELDFSF